MAGGSPAAHGDAFFAYDPYCEHSLLFFEKCNYQAYSDTICAYDTFLAYDTFFAYGTLFFENCGCPAAYSDTLFEYDPYGEHSPLFSENCKYQAYSDTFFAYGTFFAYDTFFAYGALVFGDCGSLAAYSDTFFAYDTFFAFDPYCSPRFTAKDYTRNESLAVPGPELGPS